MPNDIATDYEIRTEAELRHLIGHPSGLAAKKSLTRLDRYCREFIALSPFLCIGTMSGDGRADVSPRGDPAGFVQVLDDNTIAIPDRPGNHRLDTMSNILANPSVGLIFMIPGFEDTLRINGRATLTRDPDILERATIKNKRPEIAIRVAVEEAFLHCAKALKRSRLWEEDAKVDRSVMPSLARIILNQTSEDGPIDEDTAKSADERLEASYRNHLY
ncbi:MAG: pyridoxamine 5'-phosphate oxidase family protein [Alphaproteobacteria bacterium]|nr:pyridoxamine 5'-phosphate oxidase family protein [Alphaproteobacteria bacterium]